MVELSREAIAYTLIAVSLSVVVVAGFAQVRRRKRDALRRRGIKSYNRSTPGRA